MRIGETTDRNTNEYSDNAEGKGHRETEFGVAQPKLVPERFRNNTDQGTIRPVQYRNKRQHAERPPRSSRPFGGGLMFCCRSLQVGHTRLKARIAARVCHDIAFRVPVLLNVPDRIFHDLQPLAKNGFIHIERRIHSNHVFVIGNRPYTISIRIRPIPKWSYLNRSRLHTRHLPPLLLESPHSRD